MADIRITGGQLSPIPNTVNTTANNKPDVKVNNTPAADNSAEKTEKLDSDRRNKLREELLENVVSVSEDGDTVQVSDEGSDKLNTKAFEEEEFVNASYDPAKLAFPERQEFIISPYNDNESDISISDNTNENTYSPSITSFTGYTDAQLEQLYLKGDISRFDYDQEIEAREAQREEAEDSNRNMNEQVMGAVNGMERASQDAEQIKTAFGSESNENPDPAARIDLLSQLQDLTR